VGVGGRISVLSETERYRKGERKSRKKGENNPMRRGKKCREEREAKLFGSGQNW
jgi:hypothetical protein